MGVVFSIIFGIMPLTAHIATHPPFASDTTQQIQNKRIDEVSITKQALRRNKNIGGLAIEEVNNRFLRQHAGGSLMESLAELPGVQAMTIGAGQAKPMIRGLGFNQIVVIDQGLRHEGQEWGMDHGLEIDQYRIERAQIIKGPAAFQYGSGAIGGVVVLDSPPVWPPVNKSASLDLIGKSNNELFGGSLALQQRSKNWFWDARLTSMNHGDYRVPADTIYVYSYAAELDRGRVRNTAGRELAWQLRLGFDGGSTPSTEPNFNSSLIHSEIIINAYNSKFGFFANAHGLEPRQVDRQLHDRSNLDVQMPSQSVQHLKISNNTELNLALHRLRLNLGIQQNFRQEHGDYVNHGYMPPVFPSSQLPFDSTLERQYNKKTFSANLTDQWSINRHLLHFGIQTEWQDNQISGWNFLSPAFNQFTTGIYAYDEFKVMPEMTVLAAIRYDYGLLQTKPYTDWFTSEFIDPNGMPIAEPLQRATSLERHFDQLTWGIGINYTKRLLTLQAHLGTAFRIPLAKELAASGVNYHYFRYEQGQPELSPELSYQLDLGAIWSNHHWHMQLNPFINYFSNYIYLNPTSRHDYQHGAGNQVFQYTESKVLRWGTESRINYTPNTHWDIGITGEYLYNKQLSGTKKGFSIPFSPASNLRTHIRYQWPSKGIFEQSFIRLEHQIIAAQNRIVPPEKPTPSAQLFNLALGSTVSLGKQQVEIGLQVRNMLNTKYYNHLSFYRLIDMPETGRNVVLSLNFPFT